MTIAITIPKSFTAVLENWDGGCKRVTIQALDSIDAYSVASTKYPRWTCVEVIAK